MDILHEAIVKNLLSDALLAAVIFVLSGLCLYRLAVAWRISLVPLSTLLPIFVAVGSALYFPASPLYVKSDGELYQRWGFSIATSWLTGEPGTVEPERLLWPGKGLWPLTIAGLTVIAGPVAISLIVINAALVVFCAVLLQKSIALISGESPRWLIVLVFTSSSPFLLWGPSLLREAIFWLGVALGVLALSYASDCQYRNALISWVSSLVVLVGIRPDAGLVLAYAFAAMLVLIYGFAGQTFRKTRLIATLAILMVLVFSFPSAFDLVSEDSTGTSIVESTRSLGRDGITTAFGDSSGLETCSSISSLGAALLCSAVVNLPSALFGPFPWELGLAPIWLISSAATVHFLILLVAALLYAASPGGRNWISGALLAVAFVSLLMFSGTLTNYGALARFRAATEIILIPLGIAAISRLSRLKMQRFWRRHPPNLETSEK